MKLLKFLSWSAAHTAWITMSFSPLAIGAEAQRMSKQNLQKYVQESGLNKKITYGEFWEKTKVYYPGFVYGEMEIFFKQNKNLVMPEISISSATATDGTEIPTASYSVNGKPYTLQIFGEKNKYAKFNNVTVLESDVDRPNDLFKRMMANDYRLRNEVDLLKKKQNQGSAADAAKAAAYKKDFARFKGFPRITPALWKSLTPEKRANYLVKMRLMWLDSRKVVENKTYKTAVTEVDPIKQFYKVIFGENAQAQDAALDELAPLPGAAATASKASKAAKATPSAKVQVQGATVTVNGKPVTIPTDAKKCLVAGYIGAYGVVDNSSGKDRKGCSLDLALATYDNYKSLSYIKEANDECKNNFEKSWGACNPMVYGYPGGKAKCVDKLDPSFQDATTQVGPCDVSSPLSKSTVGIGFTKDYSNIMPPETRIALIEKDQKADDYKLTKDFLAGVLTKKDPLLLAMMQKGEWNSDLDNELVRIQNHFEAGIEEAIGVCEASFKNGESQLDKKQKSACDQLHRRWLFTERVIAELRSKACIDGSTYVGAYGKDELSSQAVDKTKLNKKTISADGFSSDGAGLCQCPDGSKIGFGKPCMAVVEIKECRPGKHSQKNEKTGKMECVNTTVVDHSCPTGTKFMAGEEDDSCVCTNSPEKRAPVGLTVTDAQALCKEESNAWKWALGIGVGIAALLWWKNRHKKTDPVTPPIAPVCNKNQTLISSGCACVVKTCPGGGVPNPNTCACDPMTPLPVCASPQILTGSTCGCADAGTCTPKPGYKAGIYNYLTCNCAYESEPITCPDGTKLAAPKTLADCPKPVVPTPTEGGSGTNPTDNGGYGGVPTGK
ncbi:MAG: hypothetical protein H7256_11375 [Bdellovibrio sp.]|nr:hypothetical protein [Bdellovibrio sp.]